MEIFFAGRRREGARNDIRMPSARPCLGWGLKGVESWLREQESNLPPVWFMRPLSRPCSYSRVEKNCGGETRTRIGSFTRRALSYPIELRRKILMERERFELSPNSLQDCRSAELSYHPKVEIILRRELVAEAGLEPARSPL